MFDKSTCRINENHIFTESNKLLIFKCIMVHPDTVGSLFVTYYHFIKDAENIHKTLLLQPNCIFVILKNRFNRIF